MIGRMRSHVASLMALAARLGSTSAVAPDDGRSLDTSSAAQRRPSMNQDPVERERAAWNEAVDAKKQARAERRAGRVF